jgi:hypothetical protein
MEGKVAVFALLLAVLLGHQPALRFPKAIWRLFSQLRVLRLGESVGRLAHSRGGQCPNPSPIRASISRPRSGGGDALDLRSRD